MPFEQLNPVAAFDKTLHDLANLTQLFAEDDSPVSDEDYLRGVHTANERLKALCLLTSTGITTAVADKIDPEVRRQFEADMEAQDAALTDVERQRRMLRVLRGLTRSKDN